MNITHEKMTFLTANYGLSPQQIEAFYNGLYSAKAQLAGEIEYSWEQMGWWPDNEEACMIECLTDADRLQDYVDGYDDWCFDFLMKAELAHDLLEIAMPYDLLSYLEANGKTSWMVHRSFE